MRNVTYIEVDKLKPFENHPYYVKDDDEMMNLTHSIKENGILSPLIVRPIENNEYEVISGHRRLHAGIKAEMDKVPALIYEMDRDAAVIALVDSNLHRDNVLPSERAFAYKMKMEALSHQGKRTDLTLEQVAPKLSAEIIGESENISKDTVKRYIRLTNLLPKLLEYVDEGRIAELDKLIERIYTDNVMGKISDERFAIMSANFETEQKELRESLIELEQAITDAETEKIDMKRFLETIRECTDLKELKPSIVNTLIKRIEVHNSIVVDGVKKVPIDIHFTAVGLISLPDEKELLELIEEIKGNPLKVG